MHMRDAWSAGVRLPRRYYCMYVAAMHSHPPPLSLLQWYSTTTSLACTCPPFAPSLHSKLADTLRPVHSSSLFPPSVIRCCQNPVAGGPLVPTYGRISPCQLAQVRGHARTTLHLLQVMRPRPPSTSSLPVSPEISASRLDGQCTQGRLAALRL